MIRRPGISVASVVVAAVVLTAPVAAHASTELARPGARAPSRQLRVRTTSRRTRDPRAAIIPWSGGTAMPQKVAHAGGATLNGKFYVAGGAKDPRGDFFAHMQIYNPVSDTWKVDGETMPLKGTVDSAVCAGNGRIYVVNGLAHTRGGVFIFSSLLVYNPSRPSGHRWSTQPYPQVNHKFLYSYGSGCGFIGSRLYLFGGFGAIGGARTGFLDTTWSFNPDTGKWSNTGDHMLAPSGFFGYTTMDPGIDVAGGSSHARSFAPIATAESYDTSTGWSSLPNVPRALLAPGMGLFQGDL